MDRGKTTLDAMMLGKYLREDYLLPLYREPGILPNPEMMLLFRKNHNLALVQGDRWVEVFLRTKLVHTFFLAIKTYRGENVNDDVNRSSEKSLSSL